MASETTTGYIIPPNSGAQFVHTANMNTARAEAARLANAYVQSQLQPAKQRDTYICPLCGNGSGSDGDGIAKDPNSRNEYAYSCFKSCGHFDLLDVVKRQQRFIGKTAFWQAVNYCGVYSDTDKNAPRGAAAAPAIIPKQAAEPPKNSKTASKGTADTANKEDYTLFFNKCHAALLSDLGERAREYLHMRGITDADIDRFSIGYCQKWKHPTSEKMIPDERIIVPRSKSSYLARLPGLCSDGQIPKMTVKQSVLFARAQTVKLTLPVLVIVEGEFDTITTYNALNGTCSVIGIGSDSNHVRVPERLRSMREKSNTNYAVLLLLDNDEGGIKTTKLLQEELAPLKLVTVCAAPVAEIFGDGIKDPNEAFVKDREGFAARLTQFINDTVNSTAPSKPDKGTDTTVMRSLGVYTTLGGETPTAAVTAADTSSNKPLSITDLIEQEEEAKLYAELKYMQEKDAALKRKQEQYADRAKTIRDVCFKQCHHYDDWLFDRITEEQMNDRCSACAATKKVGMYKGDIIRSYGMDVFAWDTGAAVNEEVKKTTARNACLNMQLQESTAKERPTLKPGKGRKGKLAERYGAVIEELTRAGRTPEQIAETIGYSARSVRSYLKSKGIAPARRLPPC